MNKFNATGMNNEQIDALNRFIRSSGRQWRIRLSNCWSTGKYPNKDDASLLQQIRNNFAETVMQK